MLFSGNTIFQEKVLNTALDYNDSGVSYINNYELTTIHPLIIKKDYTNNNYYKNLNAWENNNSIITNDPIVYGEYILDIWNSGSSIYESGTTYSGSTSIIDDKLIVPGYFVFDIICKSAILYDSMVLFINRTKSSGSVYVTDVSNKKEDTNTAATYKSFDVLYNKSKVNEQIGRAHV